MAIENCLSGLLANELPDISAVQQIEPADQACLREIRSVLRRHGLTNKFGIALLHKHFDIGLDEILVEKCNPEERTLIASPVKRSEINRANSITTLWKFSDSGEGDLNANEKECVKVCPTDAKGGHYGYKDHV